MSKFIENISTLQSNIFILTPILISFYRNLQPKDKNILLAYFVFPLVLNSDFLDTITTVSRASRLSRITNNKEIDLTSPYLVEKALKLEKEISSKQ